MRRGHIRHGSLQFYPRKRAEKILPNANWNFISEKRKDAGLLGFIGYKAGMKSAYVKDDTPNSMTKGKRIIIPVTVIECPPLKILSVRVYHSGKIIAEAMNENLDKELQSKVKLPKQKKKTVADVLKDAEGKQDVDVRVVAYSVVKKTGIKKTPDIIEIGLSGSLSDKISFIKKSISQEITIKDFVTADFLKEGVVDIRGVTKGKGFQGSTKRFGLDLLPHKTEKGIRGSGSGGPWHPARVEFRQPFAGQMGYFTRIVYNSKIVFVGDKEKNINTGEGFQHFGMVRDNYIIVHGSVQGPVKRQLLLTVPLRVAKKHIKKKFEFVELR
ncbi:MAG: hypothetical protein RL557_442 [archaeon]|jgi:large subunit ribosomal protein L3